MSSPFSSEYLANIRNGARRMVEQTRAHEGDLNELVETANGVARQATAWAVAFARPDTKADELCRLCSDQVRRSTDNAEATVRACVSAREQYITADHLYTTIDNRSADPEMAHVARLQYSSSTMLRMSATWSRSSCGMQGSSCGRL
jgi:hypothetical protein